MLDIKLNDSRNRLDGAEPAQAFLPSLPQVRRAASHIAVSSLGLAIGIALGTIATLMLGLVALC